MSEVAKTPQEIAEAIGMEEPVEETPQNPSPEAEEAKGETANDETEEETSTDEAEEADEDEETEEESENDEEEPSPAQARQARTVPYTKLKEERLKRKEAERKLAEASEKKPEPTEELSDIKSVAKSLAEDLGVEASNVEKILAAAVSLSAKQKSELPKDVQEKLSLLDKYQEEQKAKAEADHFSSEWNTLVPNLKKEYPNVTEGQLAEAKKEMDKLAFSKEFHKYDLDYVLYKNKSAFEAILKTSKAQAGAETGKTIHAPDETEVDGLVDIEDMTPAVIKQREAKSLGENKSRKDYKIYNPIS